MVLQYYRVCHEAEGAIRLTKKKRGRIFRRWSPRADRVAGCAFARMQWGVRRRPVGPHWRQRQQQSRQSGKQCRGGVDDVAGRRFADHGTLLGQVTARPRGRQHSGWDDVGAP
ncbi:hypothetical protein HPB50_001090 [Hyalomma asiaticum]|uniref:Uncharacterized protein n=1 Tax=Hyalomma asiaticum TaxID=266040 RepID=A0ACB7TA21_HYAAI|nr:hypothetical protein HPB50_001090 [Hyalomma asiaticum]